MCEASCAQGALLAVAYAPNNQPTISDLGVPVLDVLVTEPLGAGTCVSFRFYPRNAGYLSVDAVTAGFFLTQTVSEGSFLRVVVYADQTQLYVRKPPVSVWTQVASSTRPIAIPTWATCFIYLCAKATSCKTSSVVPVSAVGIQIGGTTIVPTFPPCQVLNCKYDILLTVSSGDNANAIFYNGPDFSIPQNWTNAWQTLRLHGRWVITLSSLYAINVDPAEDRYYVRLLPGQIVPIAFSAYLGTSGGQWAVVITSTVPKNTQVNLMFNNYDEVLPLPNVQWTSPAEDLCPGVVVLFSGLGLPTASLVVSHGSVSYVSGYEPGDNITAVTAYSNGFEAEERCTRFFPVTGTYTCSYTGRVPTELQPGVSIHEDLWPDAPTILALTGCRLVQCWSSEAVLINHACFRRWICQPLPSWIILGCAGTIDRDDKHGNLGHRVQAPSRVKSCKSC